jgi:heptosyltransferase-2/heptosyltransferase-3
MARRWLLWLIALVGRWFVVRRAAPAHPPRILLIKPDHLGDVLLATPALRLLRQQSPRADIVALVGPWSVPVLAGNSSLNRLSPLPFPGFERNPTKRIWPLSLVRPYLRLLVFAMRLRATPFDVALVLRDDHWWGAALALLAGIPCRVGHGVPECRPFLTTALPWEPEQHVAAQALAVVCQAVLPPAANDSPPPGLVFAPAPADREWAETWLLRHGLEPQTRGDGPALVIIHAGTGGRSKLWIAERWAAVGTVLGQRYAVRLLLTGGAGETDLVQTIAHQVHPSPMTLVGATSVGQLAALLGRAALVVGVDSGPLHLAVSQRVPTLHLFGASSHQRFGPWPASESDRPRHRVLRAGLWCSPCHTFPACPRGTDPPECMEHLTVEQVVAAASHLLERDLRKAEI